MESTPRFHVLVCFYRRPQRCRECCRWFRTRRSNGHELSLHRRVRYRSQGTYSTTTATGWSIKIPRLFGFFEYVTKYCKSVVYMSGKSQTIGNCEVSRLTRNRRHLRSWKVRDTTKSSSMWSISKYVGGRLCGYFCFRVCWGLFEKKNRVMLATRATC